MNLHSAVKAMPISVLCWCQHPLPPPNLLSNNSTLTHHEEEEAQHTYMIVSHSSHVAH